jgi:hypothetical protein
MLGGIVFQIDEPSIRFIDNDPAMNALFRVRFFIHSAVPIRSAPIDLRLCLKGVSRDIRAAHLGDHVGHRARRAIGANGSPKKSKRKYHG